MYAAKAFWTGPAGVPTRRRAIAHAARAPALTAATDSSLIFWLTSEDLPWNELSRAHQKVLERLWAGGTLRGRDPDIVTGLRLMGYIDGDRLTPIGEQLCVNALIATLERFGKPTERVRALAPA